MKKQTYCLLDSPPGWKKRRPSAHITKRLPSGSSACCEFGVRALAVGMNHLQHGYGTQNCQQPQYVPGLLEGSLSAPEGLRHLQPEFRPASTKPISFNTSTDLPCRVFGHPASGKMHSSLTDAHSETQTTCNVIPSVDLCISTHLITERRTSKSISNTHTSCVSFTDYCPI